jgi:hypothetical protein
VRQKRARVELAHRGHWHATFTARTGPTTDPFWHVRQETSPRVKNSSVLGRKKKRRVHRYARSLEKRTVARMDTRERVQDCAALFPLRAS